jgi:hemerythrin-like metal-binding protein
MDFITWDEKYELNIQEIDSQHRSLFILINRLYSSMIQQSAPLDIKVVLDELVRYALVHFKFEENFFTRIPFDEEDKEFHRKEHREFSAKVADFQKKLASGEEQLTTEVMVFLKDWLNNHILKTDMYFKEEYLKHGIK